jgi:hypothetical protein
MSHMEDDDPPIKSHPASKEYRANFDRIFGTEEKSDTAVNADTSPKGEDSPKAEDSDGRTVAFPPTRDEEP